MGKFILEFPVTGDTLTFDCVDDFTDTLAADLTANEVESGSPITDHRNLQPEVITLSGFFTDVPLRDGQTTYNIDSEGPHTRARHRLKTAHRNSEPINFTAGPARDRYDGYQLTSLTISTSPDTGAGLQVSLTLQEVRTVTAQKRMIGGTTPGGDRLAYDGISADFAGLIGTFFGPEFEQSAKLVSDSDVFARNQPMRARGLVSPSSISRGLTDRATAAVTAPVPGVAAGMDWARGI